ncbi:MAG: hypothetical protein SWY16_02565 [Cyanobacteriota bacterium]|nr:hypothetical protein [Cyanobacteriota bacterium]
MGVRAGCLRSQYRALGYHSIEDLQSLGSPHLSYGISITIGEGTGYDRRLTRSGFAGVQFGFSHLDFMFPGRAHRERTIESETSFNININIDIQI